MNKEQLLAWAVKNVTVWPRTFSEIGPAPSETPLEIHWGTRADGATLELSFSNQSSVTRYEWEVAALASHGISHPAPVSTPITAHSILEAAGGHMQDRAATYDKPEGERSMGATVEAFRAITGHKLTEEQGWLFMQLLKAVRSQQGAYRADSYEDGAAYVALAGEAAARERGSNKVEG